jgi:hypothetical protein
LKDILRPPNSASRDNRGPGRNHYLKLTFLYSTFIRYARHREFAPPRQPTACVSPKARDDDYVKLAEHITDRATQLFDEAIILERGKIQVAGALTADRPEHNN